MNSLNLLKSWQQVILRVDWYFHQNFYQNFYERFGVSAYFTVRIDSKEINDRRLEDFLNHLIRLLTTGEEIKIVLGELGRRLIDDPRIIAALRVSYQRSGKPIELIHGPHIHPETKRIFELANQGMVKIYQMHRYVPHHFILITDTSGKIHIADENPHNETLWTISDKGNIELEFRSVYRAWYIVEDSHKYAQKLLRIYENRKRVSFQTKAMPPSINYYRFKSLRMFLVAVINLYTRYVIQPLDLISDKTFPVANEYWGKFFRQAILMTSLITATVIGLGRVTRHLPTVDYINNSVEWVQVKSLSMPMYHESPPQSVTPELKDNSTNDLKNTRRARASGAGSYKVDTIEDASGLEGLWKYIHLIFDPNDDSLQREMDQMVLQNVPIRERNQLHEIFSQRDRKHSA